MTGRGARSSGSGDATSPGFDPERDLQRIGLANQTTMLMTESLEIQEMLRAAMRDRYGEEALAERFRAFDTICSATQDRQDAVLKHARRGRARRDGGDRRLQQQQHPGARPHLRRSGCRPTTSAAPTGIEGATIRHRPVGAHARDAPPRAGCRRAR